MRATVETIRPFLFLNHPADYVFWKMYILYLNQIYESLW
jgi:hypothetical protein